MSRVQGPTEVASGYKETLFVPDVCRLDLLFGGGVGGAQAGNSAS